MAKDDRNRRLRYRPQHIRRTRFFTSSRFLFVPRRVFYSTVRVQCHAETSEVTRPRGKPRAENRSAEVDSPRDRYLCAYDSSSVFDPRALRGRRVARTQKPAGSSAVAVSSTIRREIQFCLFLFSFDRRPFIRRPRYSCIDSANNRTPLTIHVWWPLGLCVCFFTVKRHLRSFLSIFSFSFKRNNSEIENSI